MKEYYKDLCKEIQVTPNSYFANLLPNESNEPCMHEEIDLGKNYVGDRGALPIIKVFEICPVLRSIKLKDNGLRNKSIEFLCKSLKQHPGGIQFVDLSHNYISTGAGKDIEALLKENVIIREVNIDGTKIDPEIRIRIQDLLAKRT